MHIPRCHRRARASYIPAETHFGDEYPLACATAASCTNIEVRPVSAEGASPIQTIRDALPILMEPQHAAGNLFWMFEIFRLAKEQGHDVLLTGQMGNPGISWTGDIFSQPLGHQIRRLGLGPWLKRRAKQWSPSMAVRIVRRLKDTEWARQDGAGRRLRQTTQPAGRQAARRSRGGVSVSPPGTLSDPQTGPFDLGEFLLGHRHIDRSCHHRSDSRSARARILSFGTRSYFHRSGNWSRSLADTRGDEGPSAR